MRLFDQGARIRRPSGWTNVHDQGRCLIVGDPISGPLARTWGEGIADHPVAPTGWIGSIFTHTGYWSGPIWRSWSTPKHLEVLRAALHLVD